MKFYYDKDIDYVEVFFKQTPNYEVEINKDVVQFRSENDDMVFGYSFENASKSVKESDLLKEEVKIEFKQFLEKGG